MNGSAVTFVDTNILVYAYDIDAGPKREVALNLISDLWRSRLGVISTQVLQEFYVTVTRKLANPLDRATARRVLGAYAAWPVHAIDFDDVVAASDIEERRQLSFWGALIISAAISARAERLVSEDFQSGRTIEGVMVVNPFE